MSSCSERRRRARRGLLLLALLAVGGCRDEAPDLAAPAPAGASRVRLLVSDGDAAIGDTVALGIAPAGDDAGIAGLQGALAFDPHRLRYVGQPVTPYLVMVNERDAGAGRLRVLSVAAGGLPSPAADLRFEVLAPDYLARLSLDVEEAIAPDLRALRRPGPALGPVVERFSLAPGAVRPLTADDWVARFEPGSRLVPGPALLPGAGLLYGDANLSGAVTVGDLVATANVAVGNLELLTIANRDFAVAANVSPANLPGLGGAGDAVPPGRNADGSYTITVGDATVIANEAAGNDPPVAGEPIPGRTAAIHRVLVTDSITLDRTFTPDTVYELRGTIIVGNPEVEHVTLTIEPGTRIEGDAASRGALVIRRGANLVAVGSRLEPIVFTCTAELKVPGCWGGVTINGFSLLNNGDPIDGGVIPVKLGKGGTGSYGGALVQDSSGALEYVRIEYAGKPTFQGDTLAGLSLLGVGTLTRIDHLQVHSGLSDAVFVSGGTARLRHLLLTDSGRDGLRWDDGWKGRGQFLVIHQGGLGRDAIHGSNSFLAPNALPRSNPVLSHVTVVGPATPAADSRALVLEDGSAGTLLNAIFLRAAGLGVEIEGDASCAQIGDSLSLVASFVNDFPVGYSTDADCVDESAFALDPARLNRESDPGLHAPFNTIAPDYRPQQGSAALVGDSLPPSDFFFDLSARYVGAAEPMNPFGSNVPWYAGWTVGW